MAEYLIPKYKLDELTKKINRIRNKGAQITFEILENNVSVPAPELGEGVVISCTKVEVEGTYIINGWRFVATIEHASPENIIRVADTSMSGRIPERYWTAPKDCEHCHIRRDRNDTYLVYNEEHDEWKQVGRTCLQSYTSGLNAETCADFASVMAEIFRLSNQTNEGNFDSSMPGFSSYISYSMPRVRKLAYKYVAEHGYTSGTTGRQFNDALTNHQLTSEATDEEIQEVTTWLDAAAIGNDWARNARNVWNKSNYELRDAGLITSAVSVYLRNRERELARNARLSDEHNSFAGQVGDKVSFIVRTCVVAYFREPSNYYAHSYPVYRMLGTDGRIYMWGSSAGVEPVAGDTIEGRIKKVSENRNGERVTELTRCKITSHQNNDSENSEPDSQHNIRSIFSFNEELNESSNKYTTTYMSDKYLSHFVKGYKYFSDILRNGEIPLSDTYNCVCIGQGYSSTTGLPTQLSRMLTSKSNSWVMGLNFYRDKLISKNPIYYEYDSTKNSLEHSVRDDETLKITYIFKIEKPYRLNILKFADRQIPIVLSNKLYDIIIHGIENQSDKYLELHMSDKKIMDIETLKKDASWPYLKTRLAGLNNVSMSGYYFVTGDGKGNKGPILTTNKNMNIIRRSVILGNNGEVLHKLNLTKHNYFINSIKDYWSEISRLENEIENLNKNKNIYSNLEEELLKIIQESDESELKKIRVLFKSDVKQIELYDKDTPYQPKKGETYLPIRDMRRLFKNKINAIQEKIDNLKSDIKDVKDVNDGLKLTTYYQKTDNPEKKLTTGGVPILIPKELMEEISKSPSLNEFEIRFKEPVKFDNSDIDCIYLPEISIINKIPVDLVKINSEDDYTYIDSIIKGCSDIETYSELSGIKNIFAYCKNNSIEIIFTNKDSLSMNI